MSSNTKLSKNGDLRSLPKVGLFQTGRICIEQIQQSGWFCFLPRYWDLILFYGWVLFPVEQFPLLRKVANRLRSLSPRPIDELPRSLATLNTWKAVHRAPHILIWKLRSIGEESLLTSFDAKQGKRERPKMCEPKASVKHFNSEKNPWIYLFLKITPQNPAENIKILLWHKKIILGKRRSEAGSILKARATSRRVASECY